MYKSLHTVTFGDATVAPGQEITAKQLDGYDIDRLIELGAIEASDLLGEASDPYAGMTAAEKKAAKKAEAEAAKAAADDGLGG